MSIQNKDKSTVSNRRTKQETLLASATCVDKQFQILIILLGK
jgi:hypothetical protein